ncbi:MAG: hypothetical protein SGILL_009168 [Bacillariaceae sp.]
MIHLITTAISTCLLTLPYVEASTWSPSTDVSQRRLEDGSNTYFEYDLNDFSLRFDHCQYVKMYDDDMAGDEDAETPLAVRHFVVFRLCPSDECSTCDSSSVYGRYVMEVDEYLQATVQEQANEIESICENCEEACNDDGSGCSGCGAFCYKYENLENNGYVDAADYIECQQVEMNGNNNGDNNENGGEDQENDDANQNQLYIGPRCSNNGDRIMLGLFSDEECLTPYTDLDVEDALGSEVSYQLLSHTYNADGNNCLSCKEYVYDGGDDDAANGNNNNQQDGNDQQDADDVNEMCEKVYDEAAKCESIYGIDAFVQGNREDRDYENQVENENVVCAYIDSLLADSYTETGDINLVGDSIMTFKDVTPVQKTAIWLLSVSVGCLIALAFFMQKRIDSSYPRVDLACQSETQIT